METIAKEGNSDNTIVALPCEICGELCPSDRLMEHQERSGQESDDDENQEEPRELNFRFDSHPYRGVENYSDGLFSEGIPRVFESLYSAKSVKRPQRQNVAIQHYEELMVLFVNTLKDLRWATAAEEDPQGGSQRVIPFRVVVHVLTLCIPYNL